MSASEIHPQIRIVVKPYASAIPLGFFAFGIGMFLYATLDAPWVTANTTEFKTVGLLLAAFVAPIELVAMVFAFLARDTMAAAALGLFSTSWLVGGLTTMQAKPGVLDPAFGYYLIAFTTAIVLLGLAAFLGKPLIGVLLLVSSLRGAIFSVYELGGGAGWQHVSGWVAVAIFCVAMYGGIAFLLEDALGRDVLPLLRIGGSREAVEGNLADQLRGLDVEPGVRHTL